MDNSDEVLKLPDLQPRRAGSRAGSAARSAAAVEPTTARASRSRKASKLSDITPVTSDDGTTVVKPSGNPDPPNPQAQPTESTDPTSTAPEPGQTTSQRPAETTTAPALPTPQAVAALPSLPSVPSLTRDCGEKSSSAEPSDDGLGLPSAARQLTEGTVQAAARTPQVARANTPSPPESNLNFMRSGGNNSAPEDPSIANNTVSPVQVDGESR